MAIEANRAGVRFDEAQKQSSDGAFSGAGFADDAECLTSVDAEGDVIDHSAWLSTATHGIGFDEMVNFDEGHDESAAARRALPANAGGQGHQGEVWSGKLIGGRHHVDISALPEHDEAMIGIQATLHSDAEVIHSLVAGVGRAGDGSIAEVGEVGISEARIDAAVDGRSDGLVEVCADVGIAASAQGEEAVALAAKEIKCRVHGIGEDGIVTARLLNGLR